MSEDSVPERKFPPGTTKAKVEGGWVYFVPPMGRVIAPKGTLPASQPAPFGSPGGVLFVPDADNHLGYNELMSIVNKLVASLEDIELHLRASGRFGRNG